MSELPQGVIPYSQPEHQPYVMGDSPHRALLIHGFPGTPSETRPLGRALADAGMQAHGLLLPGFGPDIVNLHDRSSEDWLAHIRQMWREISEGADSCTLLGYSLGGALALNLADVLKPDYLVLIAPFWKLPGLLPKLVPVAKYIMPEFKPFAKADFDDPETRENFQRIMPGLDMDDPEVQERIRTGLTLPMDTIDQVLKMGARAKRNAHLVSAPCLVVQGKYDEVVLPKFTQKLISRIRDDLLTYYPIDGEHEIIHEFASERDEVTRIVCEFLVELIPDREVAV
jgi:carboxylesterase